MTQPPKPTRQRLGQTADALVDVLVGVRSDMAAGRGRGSRQRVSAPGAALCGMAILVAACGGPVGIIPGGALSGEEGAAERWSEVVSESGTFDLETRPENPHSVRINYVFRDGNVYIDPAEGRSWYRYLRADRSVRVRIDGRIYRARAVAVTDPDERSGFDPERHVQRLELVEGSRP